MHRFFMHLDSGDIKLLIGGLVAAISGGFVTVQNFLAQTESFEYKSSLGLCITAIGYLVYELRSQRKTYEEKLDKKDTGIFQAQSRNNELMEDLIGINKKQVDWLESLAKETLLNHGEQRTRQRINHPSTTREIERAGSES